MKKLIEDEEIHLDITCNSDQEEDDSSDRDDK
jgi:hypothetical protein